MNIEAIEARVRARAEMMRQMDFTDPLARLLASSAVRDANSDLEALIAWIKEKKL